MNIFHKNTILIVNQPDDENIFASLILERVSIITICFKRINGKEKIKTARKNAILEYLLQNINLESIYSVQSKSKPKITIWYNIEDSKYVTKGIVKEESYIRNYNNLLEIQRGPIPNQISIEANNSWYEFGHPKHSQLFKVLFDILKINKKK